METKTLTCKICGADFEFTEGEQQFYSDRNLNEPRRCPNCRTKKQSGQNQRIAELEERIKELSDKVGG